MSLIVVKNVYFYDPGHSNVVRGTLDYTFSRWELDGGYPLPACWRVLEIAGVLFYRVLARVGNCPCWKLEGGTLQPPTHPSKPYWKGGWGTLPHPPAPPPSFGAVVR